MNEDALRALVRDTIARIEGAAPSPNAPPSGLFQPSAPRADPSQLPLQLATLRWALPD